MSEPIRENDPIPGYYRRRLVRGGPWVAARIWVERAQREPCDECAGAGCYTCKGEGEVPIHDDLLYCQVNGEPRDPFAEWTWLAGQPIGEDEYRLMMARGAWDRNYAPASPGANPAQTIDHLRIRPPF